MTVNRVEAPEFPAVDAEFAKAFGIASGSDRRAAREVEANLKLELKRKIDAAVKAAIRRSYVIYWFSWCALNIEFCKQGGST